MTRPFHNLEPLEGSNMNAKTRTDEKPLAVT